VRLLSNTIFLTTMLIKLGVIAQHAAILIQILMSDGRWGSSRRNFDFFLH
jgi:hypothetical protein